MADVFDNEQFRKILRKDPTQAIEILYTNYYRSLVGISIRLIRNESAAKDICTRCYNYPRQSPVLMGTLSKCILNVASQAKFLERGGANNWRLNLKS